MGSGALPKAAAPAGQDQHPAAGCDHELQLARLVPFPDPSRANGINEAAHGAKPSWVLNSLVLVITQVSLFVLMSCNCSLARQRPWNTAAKQPCPNTPGAGSEAEAVQLPPGSRHSQGSSPVQQHGRIPAPCPVPHRGLSGAGRGRHSPGLPARTALHTVGSPLHCCSLPGSKPW